jgi:radical SAM protein with 4Fe4S-binding SPASM domain
MDQTVLLLKDGNFLIGTPRTGAVSVFDETEYLAFEYWQLNRAQIPSDEADTLVFWENLGCNAKESRLRSDLFSLKLKRDGWMRSHAPLPGPDAEVSLQVVYMTVTRNCNLTCPYCYQGLENRGNTNMTVKAARHVLDRIREQFPHCKVAVSGGEPFSHPHLFDILNLLSERDLSFVILSNGTLINKEIAKKLSEFSGLAYVQVSLDGLTKKIHGLTRGNSFHAAFSGLNHLIEQDIAFSIAPTIHDGNVNEIFDLARFALSNKGYFTPNNYRTLPMSPEGCGVTLSPEILYETLMQIDEWLSELGEDAVRAFTAPDFGYGDASQKIERRHFRCGLGEAIMDIDWNGDVYPCNLLKGPRFIMGNLLEQTLNEIRNAPHIRRYRTLSTEIPKCRNCLMVGICGGGCRAAAESTFGSFYREDDLCPQLFQSEVARLTRENK